MKMKKCPKCGKEMELTVKCGDDFRDYAFDVLACDDCDYDEEYIVKGWYNYGKMD